MTAAPRLRRTPDAARAAILAAAEALLVEGGVDAVQMRAVARRAVMTDAGVAHHFGDHQGLLTALIEDAGRRSREAISAIADDWLQTSGAAPADIARLLRALVRPYRNGYAELAVALHAAGWRDRGEPVFGPVADILHAARLARWTGPTPPDIADTRLAVAAFHQAVALDPLYGQSFRRSAGLTGPAARDPDQQLEWWIATVQTALGLSS